MAIKKTGNMIVDVLASMQFSGNIIPKKWFYTILKDNGKPDRLAIDILSEIVYWYKPRRTEDKDGNLILEKKFHGDFLQLSYAEISKRMHCTRKEAYNSIKTLEKLGVLKRMEKTDLYMGRRLPHSMHFILFPIILAKLTFCEETDNHADSGILDNIENISPPEGNNILSPTKIYPSKKDKTNTKNTNEYTTNISTTFMEAKENNEALKEQMNGMLDEEVINKISRLTGLKEKDSKKIAEAAGYNYERVEKAYNLPSRKNVKNLTGWMITAIKENYETSADRYSTSFNRMMTNDINYDDLEDMLLDN